MSAITVEGHIVTAARSTMQRKSGVWQLTFDFQPPAGPNGKPRTYRVVKTLGSGNAASYACKNQEQILRRGVRVRVRASGEDVGRGISVLAPVELVETPDLVPRNVTGERDE